MVTDHGRAAAVPTGSIWAEGILSFERYWCGTRRKIVRVRLAASNRLLEPLGELQAVS